MKSVTVFDGNQDRGLPTVRDAMLVFGADDGQLSAIIESRLVTEIKTAADSVLRATCLARPDSRHLLIVGGGAAARILIDVYSGVSSCLERISVWTRRPEQARTLVADYFDFTVAVEAAPDLSTVAGVADIISSATMKREPVLMGAWIGPGTHVDLIGAFKSEMREDDDALISTGSPYVDSRETTIHHIGEFVLPSASGVISEADVCGDLCELVTEKTFGRSSSQEVTVFKNGGGARLDLMTADYILNLARWLDNFWS